MDYVNMNYDTSSIPQIQLRASRPTPFLINNWDMFISIVAKPVICLNSIPVPVSLTILRQSSIIMCV